MPCASSPAMVAALIMPRSATTQARLDAEPRPQTLDDGQQRGDVGRVTRPEERGDRPVVAIQHDAQHHLMQLRPVVLGEPRWPSVAPPRPSKNSEVVSKKATDSSPSSGWRWR